MTSTALSPTALTGPFDVIQICADRGIAAGSTKGAAQHLRGVVAGLQRHGHRVATYSGRRAAGPFPTPVHPLDGLTALDDRPDSDRTTVVYERYSLGHRGGLDLARRLGVPFVLEVNAPLVDEAAHHRPHTLDPADRTTEIELIGAADLVITVSHPLAAWVDAQRTGPTVVIPNGFEPAWFPEAATPATPEFPLVFIGHPKPWHGADRLVTLLVELAEIGRRPDLLVIGGGPGANDLHTAAQLAGVGRQLTVTGALEPPDASAMLRCGGIGLAPYRRHENFYFCPLKVVDYLAAGLPIVSTDQGDIPRMVADAGIIVDPDDDTSLVDAVVRLLDDPARRSELGAAGRARAMDSMTWDGVAHQTVAAILDLGQPTASAILDVTAAAHHTVGA